MRVWTVVTRALGYLESVLNALCRALLALIIVVISYSVVMRYVFNRPPAWAEELCRFTFIWVVMLGAIVVTREQSHIEFTILLDSLPQRLRSVVVFMNRLLMLGFCGVLVWQGAAIYPIVAEAASPTFAISMGWIYLAIPVAGVFMAVYIVENMVSSATRSADPGVKEKAQC